MIVEYSVVVASCDVVRSISAVGVVDDIKIPEDDVWFELIVVESDSVSVVDAVLFEEKTSVVVSRSIMVDIS